jgi:hypothetical protein
MSTVQEYQQIGPALRCRYAFESGVFKLEKTFVGWNLVREDTFEHQVSWDTDPIWKTTYREIYIYKVAHFFIKQNAEIALGLASDEFPPNVSLIPKHLGSVVDFLYLHTVNIPELSRNIRLAKNNLEHRSNRK